MEKRRQSRTSGSETWIKQFIRKIGTAIRGHEEETTHISSVRVGGIHYQLCACQIVQRNDAMVWCNHYECNGRHSVNRTITVTDWYESRGLGIQPIRWIDDS